MKLFVSYALIALFALSFVAAFSFFSPGGSPLLRVGAGSSSVATSGIFYLNLTTPLTTLSIPSGCNANTGGGPYPFTGSNGPPGTPGAWPPTSASASATLSNCGMGQCPFAGGPCPFSPATAQIELWGYIPATTGTGTISGTLKDITTGQTIYTFSNQAENFAGESSGATCAAGFGEDSFTIPTSGLGQISASDNYEANFTFSNSPSPPVICSGAGLDTASNILLTVGAFVAPEFPLGTILSILAPLGAVAAYVALTVKFRRPTLVK